MLNCANNFATKYGGKTCNMCGKIDDENHRINHCRKWESINAYNDGRKLDFDDIYSNDYEKCLDIVKIILSMWDLENGKNEMRKQ